MEQPEIPPEFAEISPVPSGEYWACEIEPGIFAVVPNIKMYTERYHIARAMSQVFKSKFVVGNIVAVYLMNVVQIQKILLFFGI